jgi:hypothetical protein
MELRPPFLSLLSRSNWVVAADSSSRNAVVTPPILHLHTLLPSRTELPPEESKDEEVGCLQGGTYAYKEAVLVTNHGNTFLPLACIFLWSHSCCHLRWTNANPVLVPVAYPVSLEKGNSRRSPWGVALKACVLNSHYNLGFIFTCTEKRISNGTKPFFFTFA